MPSKEEIHALADDFARTRTTESFTPGKWSVAPMNFAPQVRESIALPERVTVTDLTVSRYEQTSGIAMDVEETKTLLRKLDAMHVPILELSVWYDPAEAEVLRQYVELGLDADLSVMIGYIKGMEYVDQIDLAAKVGLDYVTITTGPSRTWDQAYRGKDVGATIEEAVRSRADLVRRAKDRGLKVRAAFQYPTYLPDLDFMLQLFDAQAEAGADSLIIMDHGGLSPALIRHAVARSREVARGVPLGLHYHDSLGMAIAGSVAAVEAGAEVIDVTINGVGSEGHADLAQLVVGLEALYGLPTGIEAAQIGDLYDLFESVSGYPTWDHKPVVGSKFFELSSDAVSRAFMIDYDPYISTTMLPEAVGRTTPFELGLQSGVGVLRRRLETLGVSIDAEVAEVVVGRALDRIRVTKAPLGDDELQALVAEAATASSV